MLLPPDNIGEGILILGFPVETFVHLSVRSFVCPFVRSDMVTTISYERLAQFS